MSVIDCLQHLIGGLLRWDQTQQNPVLCGSQQLVATRADHPSDLFLFHPNPLEWCGRVKQAGDTFALNSQNIILTKTWVFPLDRFQHWYTVKQLDVVWVDMCDHPLLVLGSVIVLVGLGVALCSLRQPAM